MNPQRTFSMSRWPLAAGLLLGLIVAALMFASPPPDSRGLIRAGSPHRVGRQRRRP